MLFKEWKIQHLPSNKPCDSNCYCPVECCVVVRIAVVRPIFFVWHGFENWPMRRCEWNRRWVGRECDYLRMFGSIQIHWTPPGIQWMFESQVHEMEPDNLPIGLKNILNQIVVILIQSNVLVLICRNQWRIALNLTISLKSLQSCRSVSPSFVEFNRLRNVLTTSVWFGGILSYAIKTHGTHTKWMPNQMLG